MNTEFEAKEPVRRTFSFRGNTLKYPVGMFSFDMAGPSEQDYECILLIKPKI
jgi:hypothetical protein